MFSFVVALSLFFVAVALILAEYTAIGWMRAKSRLRAGDEVEYGVGLGRKLYLGWRITDEVNPSIAVDRSE